MSQKESTINHQPSNFKWRLQKVLDLKTGQEQLKRTELVRITEQLAARRGELLLRRQILQDLLAEIQGREPRQRWQAQEFILRHTAADDAQIRRLQQEIAALETRHQETAMECRLLRRFRKRLEKLREQVHEQYLREQERLERKELDERTTVAFARSRTGE